MKKRSDRLFAVITTIQAPTPAVLALHARLVACGGRLVVAGDQKGPAGYAVGSGGSGPLAVGAVGSGIVDFLGLSDQEKSGFVLAENLPVGHYARKNIGYLHAIQAGATCIYETDDDNAPLDSWGPREERLKTEEGKLKAVCSRATDVEKAPTGGPKAFPSSVSGFQSAPSPNWINVYRFFTDDVQIWPRGLPLNEIRRLQTADCRPKTKDGRRKTEDGGREALGGDLEISGFQDFSVLNFPLRAPIQQGLVNGSPDVDAVWRLTQDRPFDFADRASVWLAPGQWCPFNTQSTWWWPVAYPLLYIPSYCSFRMCDIWKSFVAQRCLWAMDLGVVFHAPEVVQDRNEHNLMKDFADEVPGYLQNDRIAEVLEGVHLSSGADAVGDNLRRCYEALIAEGIFPQKEAGLVEAWLMDVAGTAKD